MAGAAAASDFRAPVQEADYRHSDKPSFFRRWFMSTNHKDLGTLGAVFSIFAGFYFWFPKMTGRMYNETLGKLHFWIFFIGVNILFFPMHFLGLAGMPRRYPDYPEAFAHWNHVASIGYAVMAFGMIFFLANIVWSFIWGRQAGDNPWGEGATTLEWTLPSPPPYHQFETLPVIA